MNEKYLKVALVVKVFWINEKTSGRRGGWVRPPIKGSLDMAQYQGTLQVVEESWRKWEALIFRGNPRKSQKDRCYKQ